ncbi:MAG: hypothetical protein WB792_14795 [Desulfobacterales bacterium]
MGINEVYQLLQRFLGIISKTAWVAVIFSSLFIMCTEKATFASNSPKNYSVLLDLIQLEDKQSSFLALNDFEISFDKNLHKTNIDFFNQHPQLVKKIKRDLDNKPIRWRLKNISHRLLYVPETRKKYAAIFAKYCHDVIGDVLKLLNLKNPYSKIYTLDGTSPYVVESDGIEALIVHHLGQEYVADYVFSNPDQKKIAIQLKGVISLNEIGSYSSYGYVNKDGSFEFTRDSYTIWQDTSKNPYTALMTPVEETLHIALRRYTEKSIKHRIEKSSIKTLKEINRIVEDSISVEEAIVGGLVHAVFPPIVQKYIPGLPASWIKSDIETKSTFKKYRYLVNGINIVERLGYKKSIELYQDNPMAFRRLVMEPFGPDIQAKNIS